MREPLKRHLATLLGSRAAPSLLREGAAAPSAALGATPSTAPVVPLEMNPHDYVAYLLTIDAEIEHALMVQYLYAGWSLGGPQVPEDRRALVAGWQATILGIAKEEMGHLIRLFWYVFAESPPLDQWSGPLQDEVLVRVHAEVDEPRRVGALFDLLIGLVEDPNFLPDAVFEAATFPFQADFDEWGRGYAGNVVPPPGAGRRADVLVVPVASRDDAVAALKQIAEQGEATSGEARQADESPSHFTRFVEVYKGVQQALAEGWQTRPRSPRDCSSLAS